MTLSAGLSLKFEYADEALADRSEGMWFEVHAENYMADGGVRLAMLDAVRACCPVSLHGVGLSLLSREPPTVNYLSRLKSLVDRVDPVLYSDHLAWQKWHGVHHADFLPFPRTREALSVAAENVMRVQDALGRSMLVENPSLYVDLDGHDMEEDEFLSELVARTGCGLLVDLTNIFVSAANLSFSADSRVDSIPAAAVQEIHIAGYSPNADPAVPLLIDSHDRDISEPVWRLFERLIARIGPRPTLIERDDDIPPFATIMAERHRAERVLQTGHQSDV